MFSTPICYLFFNRPECVKISFPIIQALKPKKLYLLSDGPRTKSDVDLCKQSRFLIEQYLNWPCDVVKIYSDENMGLAVRTVSAINEVFEYEDHLIFLEDDNLVDPSFFSYCEELLIKYINNEKIFHIGGCNYFEKAVPFDVDGDYIFNARISAWGFATWKRAWKHMDLSMSDWNMKSKDSFLKNWCVNKKHLHEIKKVFNQHCLNNDPWAWSYAWTYACWAQGALSIVPKVNHVSNIGFGPKATNTTLKAHNWEGLPKIRGSLGNIKHPKHITRNLFYEKKAYQLERGSLLRRFKQCIKSII